MIQLILFDIDGTLLDAGDLSRRAFAHVIRRFAGPEASLGGFSLSGKTDPQIMRGLLRQNGVPAEIVEAVMDEALDRYASVYLSELQRTEVRALDGAQELIERLTADHTDCGLETDRVLGILTGNLESLVAPKLEAAGICPASFSVGAFGSDDADRNKLPAVATQRAEASRKQRIRPEEVVIVGDTPLDVECARHFGAVPIAVATGDYSNAELEASRPAHVLSSLLAWDEVEREIARR
jgi:phosphoglycolate phosphatase-like HAD superfamily hydrolase